MQIPRKLGMTFFSNRVYIIYVRTGHDAHLNVL
jgi:hypothetical protein